MPHPAILDRVLGDYLIEITMKNHKSTLNDLFDEELGKELLIKAMSDYNSIELLKMFQWIIKSEPSSIRYVFGTKVKDTERRPHILQRYNRAFFIKEANINTFNLELATGKTISEKTRISRKTKGVTVLDHSPKAVRILKKYGIDIQKDLANDNREASIEKLTNIEPKWNADIVNDSLYTITEEQRQTIINNLNLSVYLGLIAKFYNENWSNYFVRG